MRLLLLLQTQIKLFPEGNGQLIGHSLPSNVRIEFAGLASDDQNQVYQIQEGRRTKTLITNLQSQCCAYSGKACFGKPTKLQTIPEWVSCGTA